MGKTVFQLSPDGGTTKYDLRDSNIAPIELDSAHASQPYAVNEEFVLDADGNLYTATSQISQGSAIVVYPTSGYNCKLSDSVTGQIKAVKDSLGTASSKNAISVVTDSSDLVESGAVKDIVGWGNKNLLNPELLSTFELTYAPIYVGNGDFTLSTTAPLNGSTANLFFLAGNVQSGAATSTNGVWNGQTRTVTSVDGYVTVASRAEGGVNVRDYNTQLEKGTVATTYETYHESVEDTLRDAEVIEAKNLLTNAYLRKDIIGGITFVIGKNKIDISGQTTNFISTNINQNRGEDGSLYLPYGTYIVTTNSEDPNAEVFIGSTYNNIFHEITTSGKTVEFTLNANSESDFIVDGTVGIAIYVKAISNGNPINVTIHPAIYKKSEYHIPLKDVVPTKADNSVIGIVEDGTTASKDYAVGDYFIKDTILGKTKAAIASGGTFTKDTNYEETNVAKEITELYKYIGILTTPVEAFTANSLPILKRNITNAFYNGSLRGEIAAGNFKNVRPGDYIIGQATGSIYYVAECDYWLGNGDSTNGTTYPAYNTHHLGLMLFKPVGTTALWRGYGYSDKSWRVSAADLGRCPWNAETTVDPTDTEAIGSNSTNITRSYNGTNMSAYMGSFIRERIDAILLPQCFQADFGSENVLKRRNWLSNAINASAASGARSDWQGIASGSVWVDRFIDLASEVELYGSRVNSSSRDDVGVQNKQLPIYRNGRIHDFYPRMDVWTKGIASATYAAFRSGYGGAATNYASFAFWACPLGCVK